MLRGFVYWLITCGGCLVVVDFEIVGSVLEILNSL
jgi:hypothetical protein